MAPMCHTCGRVTAVVHCASESHNYCLTCDYMLHCQERDIHAPQHIRYQICDICKTKPALLLCTVHAIILCQSCYVGYDDCATSGHGIRIINQFSQRIHNNNDSYRRRKGKNRREGMFEMTCNEDNTCERWVSRVPCDGCISNPDSNAVVYCAQHDKVLCNICDETFHAVETGPQHMRSMLCVNCKRVARGFRVGPHQFSFPPTTTVPPVERAEEEPPSQQDSNLS